MTDLLPGAKYIQLVEWGYPMGSLRPTPSGSLAFSTIHITGNSRLPTAEGEAAWRKNDPGLQNSATFFVNRDGSVVQTLGDPLRMDPWANGDVKSPDTANPRIAAVVRDGVNANERTLVAIENVGYEPGYPITAAQEGTCARIIAHYHPKAGVPVSRQAVIGHYQLNSISRPNCPGVDKRVIDRIVAKAQALVGGLKEDEMQFRNPIVTQDWDTVPGAASTFTRPDGSIGTFTAVERVKSIAEGTVNGVDSRLLDYGVNHEALVIARKGLTNPGPRVVGSPVPSGITQAQLDAAVAAARVDTKTKAVVAVQSI